MKSDHRILTLHPAGKQGVNIERDKYEQVRAALLEVIPSNREGVRFSDLKALVSPQLLAGGFPATASVAWYVTAVKQDLEARGELQQIPGVRPQHLRKTLPHQAGPRSDSKSFGSR